MCDCLCDVLMMKSFAANFSPFTRDTFSYLVDCAQANLNIAVCQILSPSLCACYEYRGQMFWEHIPHYDLLRFYTSRLVSVSFCFWCKKNNNKKRKINGSNPEGPIQKRTKSAFGSCFLLLYIWYSQRWSFRLVMTVWYYIYLFFLMNFSHQCSCFRKNVFFLATFFSLYVPNININLVLL